MSRSPALRALAVAAPLLVACHSAPPPRPLPVWDTFPVDYRGSFEPAEQLPADATLRADEPTTIAAATGAPSPAIAMRATLVELPADELRAILPTWPRPGPRLQGAHVERDDLTRRLGDWRARDLVVGAPQLVCGLGAHATFHDLKRTAYVSRLDLKFGADPLLVDPAIGLYEHGLELRLAPRRDGDRLALAFEWRSRDRVLPRPLGRVREGRLGTIELPMLLDQQIRGDAPVVPGTALVLGAMVGGREDTIRLLCVEVDAVGGIESATERTHDARTVMIAADAARRD